MVLAHDRTIVSDELQGVLDYLSGPMPRAALERTLDPELARTYVRGTWFRSVYYLQDKHGRWHMVYPHVDQAPAGTSP